jgi:hypothetical protein
MSYRNSSYRSGAVGTVSESEAIRKTSEDRSGSMDDKPEKGSGRLSIKPSVRILVKHGRLEVVAK